MRIKALLLFSLLWSSVLAQNTEEAKIDFSVFSGMKLTNALAYLTDANGIPFSYNPEALRGIEVPVVPDSVNTLPGFLNLVLAESAMTFTIISDTYVLFPRAQLDTQTETFRRNFSLSGIVRDINTKESLPYASVTIEGTDLFATTNTDGKFTLLNIPSDSLQITIHYLGYMPFSQHLYEVDSGNVALFEMSPRPRNLPAIEVLEHAEELIEILPGTSQISLNADQISHLPNLGESDIFSALRRLPGIQGGLDASTGLRIRGGNSDENLFLFDGITMYHVDHFYGFLSAFNTNIIKNIRINKGPYSAKYGGRTSGVVNITGIDGNKIKPSFQAELNTLSANLVVELPIVKEKASLVVAYRQSITNLVQSATYKNMFNTIFNSSIPSTDNNTVNVFDSKNVPRFSYNDFNAKINFEPSDKDVISLSYYEGRDKTKIRFEGTFDGLRRSSLDYTQWGTNGAAVKWSRKWNMQLFTYANFGISRYKSSLEAEDIFYLSSTNELLSKLYFEQFNQVRDNTLRIDNTWNINQKTHLEFGYWNSRYSIQIQAQNQVEILVDSLTKGTLDAVYAEIFRSIGEWDVSLGMRASHYSRLKTFYWEPRFSAQYPISENIVFKTSYGIFHQFIRRLNERSLYLSIPETWTLADETTIPVLQSKQYVLGFLFKPGDWQIDVEGYYKYESGTVNFLLPEFGFNTGDLDQYAINGNQQISGIDLMVKKTFEHQNLLVGYSFIQSKSKYDDINNGKYFNSPGVAQHELNLVYNYELKRWNFSAAFVITSGQPYTPLLGTYTIKLPNGKIQQFVSLGGINSRRLPWYNRLDLGITYSLPIKSGLFQTGFSIYNVYNSKGIKFIDYFEIPNSSSEKFDIGQHDITSLGFTPSLFLKIKI